MRNVGARAHSRRHEGRRIRRERQAMRYFLYGGGYRAWIAFAESIEAAFLPIVEEVTKTMTEFALALQASGGTSELEQAQTDDDPSEGVEARTEAYSASTTNHEIERQSR